MSVPVRIEDVMEAAEIPDDWEALLDPRSGAVLVVTDEDRHLLDKIDTAIEEHADSADVAALLEDEPVARIHELLGSGVALRLPTRFDFHEWEVMRSFAESRPDPDHQARLLRAIHGRGAFRVFKDAVFELDVREEWFAYRDAALRELARAWLEAQGVPYLDEREGEDE